MPASVSSTGSHDDGHGTGVTTPEDKGLVGHDSDVAQLRAQMVAMQLQLHQLEKSRAGSSSSIDGLADLLRSVSTVTPEESLLPENSDRAISEKRGLYMIKDDPWKEKTLWNMAACSMAAPGLIEFGKVPLSTIHGALSNVSSIADIDAKSHVQSFWDTATGFGSKLSAWTGSAISEASKAVGSLDDQSLLSNAGWALGSAAALTGLGYGAYGAYKYFTAPSATVASSKELSESGEAATSTSHNPRKAFKEMSDQLLSDVKRATGGVSSLIGSMPSVPLTLPNKI